MRRRPHEKKLPAAPTSLCCPNRLLALTPALLPRRQRQRSSVVLRPKMPRGCKSTEAGSRTATPWVQQPAVRPCLREKPQRPSAAKAANGSKPVMPSLHRMSDLPPRSGSVPRLGTSLCGLRFAGCAILVFKSSLISGVVRVVRASAWVLWNGMWSFHSKVQNYQFDRRRKRSTSTAIKTTAPTITDAGEASARAKVIVNAGGGLD